MIGASGAIAGVLGAYLVWYPWARVRTLVFLLVFMTFADLPAPVYPDPLVRHPVLLRHAGAGLRRRSAGEVAFFAQSADCDRRRAGGRAAPSRSGADSPLHYARLTAAARPPRRSHQ